MQDFSNQLSNGIHNHELFLNNLTEFRRKLADLSRKENELVKSQPENFDSVAQLLNTLNNLEDEKSALKTLLNETVELVNVASVLTNVDGREEIRRQAEDVEKSWKDFLTRFTETQSQWVNLGESLFEFKNARIEFQNRTADYGPFLTNFALVDDSLEKKRSKFNSLVSALDEIRQLKENLDHLNTLRLEIFEQVEVNYVQNEYAQAENAQKTLLTQCQVSHFLVLLVLLADSVNFVFAGVDNKMGFFC